MLSDSNAASSRPTVVLATWRHVLIALFCETPTAAHVNEMGTAFERLLVRYPKGIRVIVYAKSGLPLPGNEARAAAQTIARTYARRTLANAIVLPGQGFWLSAARSVVDGTTQTLGPGAAPHAVFRNIPQAIAWLLADEADPTVEPADLAETVRSLAERYDVLDPTAWNDLPLRRSTFRPKR